MVETGVTGNVIAISVSESKGVQKQNVDRAQFVEEWGIKGDAHAGKWHRQISLLALESISKMRAKGLDVDPGAFAENICTEFIDLPNLQIGDSLKIGAVELEITQIGKECHKRCAIFYAAGDCVMPREGVFARVLSGGEVKPGDTVEYHPTDLPKTNEEMKALYATEADEDCPQEDSA